MDILKKTHLSQLLYVPHSLNIRMEWCVCLLRFSKGLPPLRLTAKGKSHAIPLCSYCTYRESISAVTNHKGNHFSVKECDNNCKYSYGLSLFNKTLVIRHITLPLFSQFPPVLVLMRPPIVFTLQSYCLLTGRQVPPCYMGRNGRQPSADCANLGIPPISAHIPCLSCPLEGRLFCFAKTNPDGAKAPNKGKRKIKSNYGRFKNELKREND